MDRELQRLEAVEQSLSQSEDTSYNRARLLIAAARHSLAVVNHPSELKKARDIIHTALEYFKMRNATLVACNELSKERVRIEYEIGRLLLDDDEIHKGGLPAGEEGRQTLETKYGISRWQAQRYRKTASVDPEDLEQIFEDIEERQSEITSAQVSAYISEWFGGGDERGKLHWSIAIQDAVRYIGRGMNQVEDKNLKYRFRQYRDGLDKILRENN